MIYLDTHVVTFLYEGDLRRISRKAQKIIDQEDDVRISPMVLLELEYMYEIQRIKFPGRKIVGTLASDIGLKICDAPFEDVIEEALQDSWTRDPFDRIILAQARGQKAVLITLDRSIHGHYAHAVE